LNVKRTVALWAAVIVVAGGFFLFLYHIETLIAFMKGVTGWLVETVGRLGYPGVVALMFLESSFFPFPSEVVLPPAGYLAWKGEMSFVGVVASGITGSLLGALFNYWFAFWFGRPFLIKYGKYFFVSEDAVKKADVFFTRHGHISTLVGRLLPVIRQYISLPAGIARMRLDLFAVWTTAGAGLWVVVLTCVGYLLGERQEFLERWLHVLTIGCVLCAVALAVGYFLWFRKRRAR
jgi:membrane protein DedA with SNARE-associated domain